MKLKKVSQQTIVITGASSGIGLTTARMAAEQGANLVLVARNEDALRELADEINQSGGKAIYLAADVADENAIREAADLAIKEFGGFDTWVNNAGISIYGRITDVPTKDFRRLFDTNVWGVVNGSRIAVEHLKDKGGALINVGSEVSEAPIPLQGIYSASKHAVKGFTDALRMEVEGDGFPVSVTLIKPTAIHTPFPENAKNYLPYEPQLPPPVYAPDLVAEAILHCAENQVRDFYVGGMAKAHASMAQNAPRLYEKMNEALIGSFQNSGKPTEINRSDGLYETNSNLYERGAEDRFVRERSLYQQTKIHPLLLTALTVGGGLGIAALLASGKIKDAKNYFGDGNSKNSVYNIRQHAEVIGSDGAHVGTVDRIEYGEIKLTKKDSSDGRHHFISTDLVEEVSEDRVYLSQTADQARQTWRGETTDATVKNIIGTSLTGNGETAKARRSDAA